MDKYHQVDNAMELYKPQDLPKWSQYKKIYYKILTLNNLQLVYDYKHNEFMYVEIQGSPSGKFDKSFFKRITREQFKQELKLRKTPLWQAIYGS